MLWEKTQIQTVRMVLHERMLLVLVYWREVVLSEIIYRLHEWLFDWAWGVLLWSAKSNPQCYTTYRSYNWFSSAARSFTNSTRFDSVWCHRCSLLACRPRERKQWNAFECNMVQQVGMRDRAGGRVRKGWWTSRPQDTPHCTITSIVMH